MLDETRLKNRPQCVLVKGKLEVRLDILENRDRSNDFADRQTTRREATAAERLVKAINDLAAATTQLARTDLAPAERRRLETLQLAARHTRDELQGNEADEDAADAFEADVVAELVDVQVPVLRAAIVRVQARHDALPA